MWLRRILPVLLLLPVPALAQKPYSTRDLKLLYEGPTLTQAAPVVWANTSPDNRWVVFVRRPNDTSGRLYIARTGSRTEKPLTSDGYDDRGVFFSGNERVFFTSSRGDRTGKGLLYGMVQSINPATGDAVGTPVQVTTEPVVGCCVPSRNGKLIAYVTKDPAPQTVRVAPATGGTPRTIYTTSKPVSNLVFSKADDALYLTEGIRTKSPQSIMRISLKDGKATTVYTEQFRVPFQIRVLPADPRYIIHQYMPPWGVSRRAYFDLTLNGKRVGRVLTPRGIVAPYLSSDGFGLIGRTEPSLFSTRVVSVDGRETKVLTVSDSRWVEGWSADSRSVLVDDQDSAGIVVQYLPLNGAPGRPIRLPADATVHGWGGTIGNYLSYWTAVRDVDGIPIRNDKFFAFDARSAKSSLITQWGAAPVGADAWNGRGGLEYDGDSFIYGTPGTDIVTIRAKNPETGVVRTVRAVPRSLKARKGVQVAGKRLAWQELAGDSIVIMVTNDATSPPVKVASFPNRAGDEVGEFVVWSHHADRLAIAHNIKSTGGKPAVTIISLDNQGHAAGRMELLTNTSSVCWNLTWHFDDRSLLMQCKNANELPNITVIPLDGRQVPAVLTRDDKLETWDYYLSPDGKWVAYSAEVPRPDRIWRIDFRSFVK